MTRKGKRKAAFEGSLYHGYESGYIHSRGVRQHRREPHYTFSSMEIASSNESATKKQKGNSEAHIIPGVDGRLVYGFPNSIITKLRYCDVIQLTSTLGSISTNVFNANSIFDPDATGVGHQPLYRDQYAAIYDQYTVLGSKITVTFQPYQVDQAWVVGIVGDDDSSISSTLTTRMEQNNSIWRLIGTNDGGPYQLSLTYSPIKDIGVDVKNDGYSQTAVGSNPSELFCFAVWGSQANATLSGMCQVAIEIEYTVKFAELLTPTQS